MVDVTRNIYQKQLWKATAVLQDGFTITYTLEGDLKLYQTNNLSLMQCTFKSHLERNHTLDQNGSSIRRSL